MAKFAMGVDGPDLGGGADLAAVGNVGRASKRATSAPQELTSFSVKRGDNGGVLVCETYEKKPPAGRRVGASYPGGGDYKENPFSPDDGAAAASHITGLLGEMGVSAPAPAPLTPAPPPRPPMAPPNPGVARAPMGGGGMLGEPEVLTMPAKSGAQYRLMQAAAHGTLHKKGGPSPAVAREFIAATPPAKRKTFAKKKG